MAFEPDIFFMRQALRLARRAAEEGEVPIGALVVAEGEVLGKGYNQTERLLDCTAHAEMIALTAACSTLGSKYLPGCTVYVTVEPCVMCAGALRWAQIERLVYAAPEQKTGFTRLGKGVLHPKTLVTQGLLHDESKALMQDFFRKRR